jgi:tetratricopeptide (TPR) repeat protein
MLMERAFSDGRGRFVFRGLGANSYTLVVDDQDHIPVNQVVTIRSLEGGGAVRANITLRPLESEAQALGSEAMEADPQAATLAALLAVAPAQLRKEFEKGVKAGDEGKTDRAIKHYKKAIEIAPDFYPAHNNLGYQYLNQGNLEAAEQAFTEVIKLNQGESQAYFGLGNVFLQTERYPQAEEVLREGLQRDPRSAFGNYLLGSVHFRTGRFSEAEKCLRAALFLDPNLSLAHMALVDLYLQQQRDADALNELKSFIERFPDHPMFPQAKEMLQKLEEWLQSQSPG